MSCDGVILAASAMGLTCEGGATGGTDTFNAASGGLTRVIYGAITTVSAALPGRHYPEVAGSAREILP